MNKYFVVKKGAEIFFNLLKTHPGLTIAFTLLFGGYVKHHIDQMMASGLNILSAGEKAVQSNNLDPKIVEQEKIKIRLTESLNQENIKKLVYSQEGENLEKSVKVVDKLLQEGCENNFNKLDGCNNPSPSSNSEDGGSDDGSDCFGGE